MKASWKSAGRGRQIVLHVAFMLHGVAGRFWKWPENNENKLQHVQHEDGEARNKPLN